MTVEMSLKKLLVVERKSVKKVKAYFGVVQS